MHVARSAAAWMLAVAALAACSSSAHVASEHVAIAGRTASSTFEATISYPRAARAGGTISVPMSFRNTGSGLASFQFDIAVDGPPQCAIENMMAWRTVRGDLRPGAEAAAIRWNHLPIDTDLRELGLWPESGFNLRVGEATRTVRTLQLPRACRGKVDFVAVARPYGTSPLVRHLRVTVA